MLYCISYVSTSENSILISLGFIKFKGPCEKAFASGKHSNFNLKLENRHCLGNNISKNERRSKRKKKPNPVSVFQNVQKQKQLK